MLRSCALQETGRTRSRRPGPERVAVTAARAAGRRSTSSTGPLDREGGAKPSGGGMAAGGKRHYCLTAAVNGGWRRCRPPGRLGILGPGEKPAPAQFGPRELTPTRRGFLQRGDDMTANAQAEAPGSVANGHATKGTRQEGRPAVRPRLVARLRGAGQRRRLQAIGSGGATIHQAAAALPHQTRGRATERLRDQLTVMALAAGLTPDWSTLAVIGPTEMTGTQHGARFEWTGRVAMRGSSPLMAVPDPDDFLQHPAADGDTVPFRVEGSWNGPGWAEPFGSAQPSHRRSLSEIATRPAA